MAILEYKLLLHINKNVSWSFGQDYTGESVPEEIIHQLTPILIMKHPLSASSIYYDL